MPKTVTNREIQKALRKLKKAHDIRLRALEIVINTEKKVSAYKLKKLKHELEKLKNES